MTRSTAHSALLTQPSNTIHRYLIYLHDVTAFASCVGVRSMDLQHCSSRVAAVSCELFFSLRFSAPTAAPCVTPLGIPRMMPAVLRALATVPHESQVKVTTAVCDTALDGNVRMVWYQVLYETLLEFPSIVLPLWLRM